MRHSLERLEFPRTFAILAGFHVQVHPTLSLSLTSLPISPCCGHQFRAGSDQRSLLHIVEPLSPQFFSQETGRVRPLQPSRRRPENAVYPSELNRRKGSAQSRLINSYLRTGNKATLITRLQEHEKQGLPMRDPTPSSKVQSSPTAPKPLLQHVRQAHTTEVPGVPSSSEPPLLSPNFPKEFLDVKIPVPSKPFTRAPTPIVSNCYTWMVSPVLTCL